MFASLYEEHDSHCFKFPAGSNLYFGGDTDNNRSIMNRGNSTIQVRACSLSRRVARTATRAESSKTSGACQPSSSFYSYYPHTACYSLLTCAAAAAATSLTCSLPGPEVVLGRIICRRPNFDLEMVSRVVSVWKNKVWSMRISGGGFRRYRRCK
ncbi:hypothetical protein M378DRAFT_165701 [Amanita muscaria Koide BX008]|uniref:Uncharacterized protein n=1 Tax=Amanita muscaria (strain Koide BX008) TaxID=946122 RepID=A0A0C2X1E3_AMAMK|nr:hypothetical protein M378DRAFT_165701 [Amanita muscaria Koide BX008]